MRKSDESDKMKEYFLDLEPDEIEKTVLSLGEKTFRAKQLIEWAYKKRTEDFSKCATLPLALRDALAEKYSLRSLKFEDVKTSRFDGTARFHFLTRDGYNVFAVFLPAKERNSVCLSTQVGCPVGCAFCFSGKTKFKRNLTRGEILEQIIRIEKESGAKISGVLFMGMGEPLLNFDNVLSAVRSLIDYRQFGIGRRHITISTVGLVPLIRKLADEELGVRLALSLHAPDDTIRKKLISGNISYTVNEILKAGLYFARKNNSRLTVEYILIAGVNDSLECAKKFVKLLERSSRAKDEIQVNLIPFNDTNDPGLFSAPAESNLRFKNFLIKNGVLAMIRQPRGADIGAACGQLGI